MSDFLSNLLIRHQGAAPSIQPRLPSLFEPSTPHMGSFAEASPRTEERLREAPIQAALDDARVSAIAPNQRHAPILGDKIKRTWNAELPSRAAKPLLSPEPIREPVSNGPVLRPLDSVPSAQSSRVPLPAEAAARPARSVSADASPNEEAARALRPAESLNNDRGPARVAVTGANERPIARNESGKGPVFEKSVVAGLAQTAGQPREARDESSERVEGKLAEPKYDGPQPIQNATESPLQSRVAELAQSRTADMIPRVGAASEPTKTPRFEFARHVPPPTAAPPEPTIQVTIGRIEVRAVSSQAPAKKERAESPVMSLNEYLRSRRGGA